MAAKSALSSMPADASPFPDEEAKAKPFWEQIIVEEPAWSLGPVALGPKRRISLEIRIHADARSEVVRLDGQPLGDLRERHRQAIDAAVNRLMVELRAARSERISKTMQPITKRTARTFPTPHPDVINAQEAARHEALEKQALTQRKIAEQIDFAERMQRRRKEVESTRSFRRQDPSPPPE